MKQRYDEGVAHMQFVADLYMFQIDNQRYFLHEHPLKCRIVEVRLRATNYQATFCGRGARVSVRIWLAICRRFRPGIGREAHEVHDKCTYSGTLS